MNIQNKVAVITGAAGGIGSALCRALAANGAKVVVSDLNLQAAQTLATEIDGVAVQCDVSKESEIQNLVNVSEQNFGQVDIFCSNAGFGRGEPSHAASASDKAWQLQWDVHVMAHVWAARALLPNMIERGDGYLLNVASAAGLLNQIGDAAYSATKHAAVSVAESLAINHNDDGVKVSVICPQYVNTDILMITKEQRQQDLPGVISPQQCADVIIKGIEDETFMILPHPQVADFYQKRAADPGSWIEGMRRYRKSLLNDSGKLDMSKIFGF